jgi:D-sedoheptulose 7-phosphate isomerase
MTNFDMIELYKRESSNVFSNVKNEEINAFVEMVFEAYEGENTIFACGNGGNVAAVENLVVDLNMHPFVSDNKTEKANIVRNKFHTINLCNSSGTITGISNDLGYEHIFSEQLVYQGKEDDILFAISGSGNSKNVLKALAVCRDMNMKSVVITRNKDCKAYLLADLLIVIPGTSKFPGQIGKNNNNFHFEDCISKITHIAVGLLKKKVQDSI